MSIDLQGPRAALFGLSGDLEMFRTVTLAETVERADLSKRTDRKYLVDLETVRRLMSGLTETRWVRCSVWAWQPRRQASRWLPPSVRRS